MRMQRSQSAMEYLMTYGWSILVLAIVVGVLYSIGAFNSSSGGGAGSCSPASGWQCSTPTLAQNGLMTMSVGQIVQQISLAGAGCSNSNSKPTSFTPTSASLSPGQTVQLQASCPITSTSIGSRFQGTVWITYNTLYRSSQTSKVGAISVPISQTAVVTTSSTSTSSTSTTVTTTILYEYVPLTITNSQSSATGSNFQQMISFNPSSVAYASNETSDLGNIRFYTTSNTELYSWCESGCSSGSSNAVFWLLLPSGISGSSNLVVNMEMYQAGNTEYDGVYAGECPTCSSSYGQYDNGAGVFTFYDNFVGPTLSSKWTSVTGGTGFGTTSATVSDGLTLSLSSPNNNYNQYYIVYSASTFGTGYIGESLTSWTHGIINALRTAYPGFTASDTQTAVGADQVTSTKITAIGAGYGGALNLNSPQQGYSANNVNDNGYGTSSASYNNIEGIYYTGSTNYFYNNYVQSNSLAVQTPTGSQYLVLGVASPLAAGQWGTGTFNAIITWARVRLAPPNGVMPSTSFGSMGHN